MSKRRQRRYMDVIVYGDTHDDLLSWVEHLAQEGATIERVYPSAKLTSVRGGRVRTLVRAHVVYGGSMLLLGAVWARFNDMKNIHPDLYRDWDIRMRIHRECPSNLFNTSE